MRKSAIFAAFAAIIIASSCSNGRPSGLTEFDAYPQIWPDYVGVTIPRNIAPMDFCMRDSTYSAIDVRVRGGKSGEFSVNNSGTAIFPIKAWKRLLQDNAGDSLYFSVAAKAADGWKQWKEFGMAVCDNDIDYGLTYRLIAPGYQTFSEMGIYERDLSSFKERALITNEEFNGCVNCHSYNRCDPKDFSLHIRGSHGATIIRKDGMLDAYNTKTDSTLGFCVYPYWHPSGNYIAYSTNTTRQTFHMNRAKLIEVFDTASDILVYDVRNNCLISSPSVKQEDVWETYPVFSSDGGTIYFCAAQANEGTVKINDMSENLYGLYKVSFDAATGTIGSDVELVIDAAAESFSIAFPKPSFDGKYIMYTQLNYGNFPVWHPEADLWLYDIASGERRELVGVNSNYADSYHNWSSDSRWFVFGSRRVDAAFTRPYICGIDENGNVGKPFLVPQREPREYYRQEMHSYNVPEFVTGPVDFDNARTDRLINSTHRTNFLYRN